MVCGARGGLSSGGGSRSGLVWVWGVKGMRGPAFGSWGSIIRGVQSGGLGSGGLGLGKGVQNEGVWGQRVYGQRGQLSEDGWVKVGWGVWI